MPRPGRDDTLALFFMCCHPALAPTSAVALTLRALGGLSTREIAAAFLVPEATMAQRISRAKRTVAESGQPFALPDAAARAERLPRVLRVVYLIFNEGYASSSGPDLARTDLAAEAVRLARLLHELLPDDPEVAGLLALMLLTEARRPARTDGRRRPRPAGRAGPRPLGPGPDRRGHRAGHRRARPGADGPVPAPRRRSPRCTMSRPATRTPTGDGSCRSTPSWNG